jgi:anti-sigma28 factor (negative regulator of flagellin synthesis)
MKVVDRNLSGGSPVESGRTHETQRASGTTGAAATTQSSGSGDQVEFSSGLGSLARAMSTLNTNRANKMQAITAQYQSGAYRADSYSTSRTMIDYALNAGDQ